MATLLESEKRNLDRKASEKNLQSTGAPAPARGTVQFGAARAMEMAARISGRRTLRAPTPSPLVREGARSGDELWRRCRELTAVSDKGLRALRSVNVEKWFLAFWFSPDDRHFAAGAKEIYMYDLGNGEKKLAAKRTSMVYACACSPCATLFCVGDEEGHLLVYTLLSDPSVEVTFPWIKRKEGEPPPVLWETRLDSSVTDAAFSTDGKWIAAITRSGSVRVFNAVDCVEGTGGSPPRPRKRPHPLTHGGRPFIANGGHESVSTIAFSENVLAVAGGASGKDADTGDSFRVGLWRMPDLEELDSIELGINAVTPVASVAFRPDGLQLAVGTQSGTIRVYNIQPDGSADHDGARETRVHKSPPLFWRHYDEGSVNALCFSNTAGCIHSIIDNAQDENGVYANEKCSCCSKRHKPRWLLAGGLGSGTFQVYDAATTARKASFKLERSGGTVCQFSPDDMQLAVGGGAAQHVVLHELRPLEPVGRFAVNMERRPRRPSWDQKPEKISGACVSKDYVALASGSVIEIRDRSTRDNDRVCRINVMIDKARLPPRGGESPARTTGSRHREDDDIAAANAPIALRPSGEYVAVVVAKKTVCIYELPSGEKVMELPGYTGEVTGVKWSPNGKLVISWGSFGVRVNVAPDHDDVHLHSDQSPGATVLEFSDKGGVATNCVINNRGNLIASCGYSDTVVVRKVADGSKIFTFHQGGDQPAGSTGGVCFSDDGKRLAYHVDKTVLVRSMEDDKGGKAGRVVMKFDDIDAVPVPMGAFSPGRGDMLLCLEGVLGPDKPDDTHQIFVLDVSSGEVRPGPIHRNSNTPEDPPRLSWDSTLRPCLPTGEILSHCIGWLPTIPAYTFESCTCHVGGLGPQHDPDALAHVFSQFGRVVQATVRTRKGVNQNWALITLGDHEAVTAACEASGKPMVHHFKVSHVGKDKAEASTGSFAQIWKESRQKAAEADADRSHHADQADDADDVVERKEGDEVDGEFGNTQGTPTPLLLWAATDDEMVVMDIRQFGFAAEDGAISQKQLVTLTNWDERAVADVAGRLPHSVNIRDPASGDTVLHDVVRRGNFEALDAWLAGGAVFTPIANYCAHTALDEAITQHSRTAVTHLVQNIIATLNDVTSPLVTASLKRLAQEMPELSLEVLQSLERRSATNEDDFSSADGAVVQTNRKLHEKFHAGREPSGALVIGAESRQFTAGQWNSVLPSPNRAATDMEVASKVVAMANFIGPPDESPFWDLVENGIIDAGVFDSKLLQLAVQYKWQNVHPIARREFMIYLCHFIIMCLTLIVDTQGHVDSIYCNHDGDGSTDPADPSDPAGKVTPCWVNSFAGKPRCWLSSEFAMNALYVILLLSNTRMLLSECKEIVAEIHEAKSCIKGLRAFMNDFWNYFDCGSVIFVYLAAWAHYAGDPCSVEQLGAVAIILNSVSVIQLMRPFTQTGALIQTVINIVIDIRGFWYICLVVLFGFTCALTVCQPRTAAFTLRQGVDNNSIGVAYPLLTMFSSMVGAFELDEYTNAQSTVLLVLFLLFIVIIMLNLLITIIGESYGNIKQKEQVTMLRLRAEVIVEEEKKHESWKTDTTHVAGRRVWYNRETGDTRSTRPAGIDPLWADIGQAECDMGHDGMPKGSPWLLRQERGCTTKELIYPRYLHFCEPAEASDSMEQLNAFQIEKDFRASVRRDLKKMDKHITKLQDDIMDKMGAIESLLKDRH